MKFKTSNPKVEIAINYATINHEGQLYGHMPFITHPLTVMNLVSRVTDDQDILCAAVLHDIMEDTIITPKVIEYKFGKRVADIVKELSINYTTPKNIRIPEAVLIKMADVLCNLLSSVDSQRAMKTIKKHQSTFRIVVPKIIEV